MGKIPFPVMTKIGRIPKINKRVSMVENENMSKHSSIKRNAYTRPDYMPLFKRYAFEAGGNHGYGDVPETMYKRFYKGAGGRNFIQLASSMAQKRGSWQQDPRAGLLLMKGNP